MVGGWVVGGWYLEHEVLLGDVAEVVAATDTYTHSQGGGEGNDDIRGTPMWYRQKGRQELRCWSDVWEKPSVGGWVGGWYLHVETVTSEACRSRLGKVIMKLKGMVHGTSLVASPTSHGKRGARAAGGQARQAGGQEEREGEGSVSQSSGRAGLKG